MAGARAIQGGVDLLRKIAFNSSQSCSALTIPRCGDGTAGELTVRVSASEGLDIISGAAAQVCLLLAAVFRSPRRASPVESGKLLPLRRFSRRC